MQADTAPEFDVTGNPARGSSTVRTLERDVAGLTALNPYTGATQNIANYIADPVEEGILHIVSADPARTPSFALFAKPDYYLSAGSAICPAAGCVTQNAGFAYDHGDYAAEINTNYVGFAGPGVKRLGLDASGAADGPNSAGPDSGQVTVVNSGTKGTWTDETDIEPTELYLLGLRGDYDRDGRVITEILRDPNPALRGDGVSKLGACYKQLNSSVGAFGADTLIASTSAVESAAPGDALFTSVNGRLLRLEKARDALAGQIKGELNDAAFFGTPVRGAGVQTVACEAIIAAARTLAAAR